MSLLSQPHRPLARSLPLIAAAMLAAPCLIFPELLPISWRVGAVTLLTSAAIGIGVMGLWPYRAIRPGVWLFGGATLAAWAAMPQRDALAIRHFAGIGLGILTMALVASWCTDARRLLQAGILFALASSVALTIGLLGASVIASKLSVGPTPVAPKTGILLPRLKIGLPGLEENDGRVNANALGGTALLLAPSCAVLSAAALIGWRRQRLALGVGALATVIAVTVLGMSRSRTALIAGTITLLVLGISWRRGRASILVLLVLLSATTAAVGLWNGALPPEQFDHVLASIQTTALAQVDLASAFDHGAQARGLGSASISSMNSPALAQMTA